MYGKQGWKAWLRATLFVALAAFIAIGFTFATHDTAAADTIPCAAPAWTTEDSHIPQDAVDAICAIVPSASSVTQKARDATRFTAPAASFDSGSHFEAYLEALEVTERELNAAFTAPSVSFENSFIHWEVHQKATGTTEYRGP